jgi:hypothetical protein
VYVSLQESKCEAVSLLIAEDDCSLIQYHLTGEFAYHLQIERWHITKSNAKTAVSFYIVVIYWLLVVATGHVGLASSLTKIWAWLMKHKEHVLTESISVTLKLKEPCQEKYNCLLISLFELKGWFSLAVNIFTMSCPGIYCWLLHTATFEFVLC